VPATRVWPRHLVQRDGDTTIPQVPLRESRPTYVLRLAALAIRRPLETLDRVRGRRARAGEGEPVDVETAVEDPNGAAHELVGVSCETCSEEVAAVRSRVLARLASDNRRDGGAALAEMLYIITRHQKPQSVLETGVARGISSAFILSAMEHNGHGRLWSIDLPPMSPDWRGQSRSAVDPALAGRWTYIRGAGQRHLPRVLRRLGAVDIFVHDGLHTQDNMLFEMRSAWPRIVPGGVLVVDDADDNEAVVIFGNEVGATPVWVKEPDKGSVVACLRKPY
jgi:hypothetical protein